jgi:flavin reductase (DIM6/NTAB) family NADH-FMN oxidoreductase RutF
MPAPPRKRSLALSKVYGLLEPGPVLLLTTSHKGAANVMTMSWHTMLEFEPPLVGCVVSHNDFSFKALNATRQCALNIRPSSWRPRSRPLIAECYANLGCRVVDTRMKNRYNFFVLEVLKAWMAPSAPRFEGGQERVPRALRQAGAGLEPEQ